MLRFFLYMISTGLFWNTGSVTAQGITGTWEGIMGHQFLQINIKDEDSRLCGYTYDHFVRDVEEHCKAYFTGYYDRIRDEWVIRGYEFIENSGSHVLMQIYLWRQNNIDKNVLRAYVTAQSMPGENLSLRKVSTIPQPLNNLPVCLDEPIKKPLIPPVKKPVLTPTPSKPVVRKPALPRVVIPKPVIVTIPVPDSPIRRKPVIPSVITRKDTPVLQKMTARKKNAISRLETNVKHITLAVYDNGIIDGDTVSIFFNKKLLVNKQLLTAKPITINIDFDENIPVNEIVLYAENLGSIPPNTALIIVTAGDKRYELHASSDLQENAVLEIDYKPE